MDGLIEYNGEGSQKEWNRYIIFSLLWELINTAKVVKRAKEKIMRYLSTEFSLLSSEGIEWKGFVGVDGDTGDEGGVQIMFMC